MMLITTIDIASYLLARDGSDMHIAFDTARAMLTAVGSSNMQYKEK